MSHGKNPRTLFFSMHKIAKTNMHGARNTEATNQVTNGGGLCVLHGLFLNLLYHIELFVRIWTKIVQIWTIYQPK